MIQAPQAPPYSRSLAQSIALHAALLAFALLVPRLISLLLPTPSLIEIEITDPYLGDGPRKLGAAKPLTSGIPAKVNATAALPLVPAPAASAQPAAPAKDWVLPDKNVKPKVVETPSATGAAAGAGITTTAGGSEGATGTAAKVGGSGEGSDEGVSGGTGHGGTPLSAFPQLLNRDEVFANLRRLYPEAERAANREGDVVVVIHIAVDGAVTSVDVRSSSGAAFDEAARKVGQLMRFSPALGLNGKPVPVRLPQTIQFRLTN